MSVDFDASELVDLAADLGAAGARVTRVSSTTMSEVAARLAVDAKRSAPVDTGELRDSIKVRGGQDYRIVLADAPHAFFVEFGTSVMAPQPYLWPHVGTAARALAAAHAEAASDIF